MIFGGLDLGVSTGFAFGPAGAKPRAGFVILKRRGENQDIAFSNLIAWLYDEWTPRDGTRRAPHVLACEKPMTLGAFSRVRSSEDNVLMHFGLRAIVLGMCRRFGVEAVPVGRSTVMKHFVGNGGLNREDGKVACLARCRQLKLMRADQYSEDTADAVAVWDWLVSTRGGRMGALNELVLFPDTKRRRRR
jgi:hypothetical protein